LYQNTQETTEALSQYAGQQQRESYERKLREQQQQQERLLQLRHLQLQQEQAASVASLHPNLVSSSAYAVPAVQQHEATAQWRTFVALCTIVVMVCASAMPALLLCVVSAGLASTIFCRTGRVACILLTSIFWLHLSSSGSLPMLWTCTHAAFDAFVAGVAPWHVWACALGAAVTVFILLPARSLASYAGGATAFFFRLLRLDVGASAASVSLSPESDGPMDSLVHDQVC
jgi:hypothetical protein